eukprot:sb/3474962/
MGRPIKRTHGRCTQARQCLHLFRQSGGLEKTFKPVPHDSHGDWDSHDIEQAVCGAPVELQLGRDPSGELKKKGRDIITGGTVNLGHGSGIEAVLMSIDNYPHLILGIGEILIVAFVITFLFQKETRTSILE